MATAEDCGCKGTFMCIKHKLAYWREEGGLQISPAATPSRRHTAPPRTPNNSWEKGTATDSRGMPILKPGTVDPMGVKEYGERRHEIEQGRRALANGQPPNPTR